MSWALISDSSCNLRDWHPTAPNTTFAFAPLKIRVGEREFVDNVSLDVHELIVAIQSQSSASSSSCPSAGEWSELFKLADKTICMPISEGLSGSYNAAATARDMVLATEPERQIHLVNSRAAGGKMDLIFLLFDRYLANNPNISFEDACAYFDELEQNSKILFSLCNYENLAKAGRIPKAAGVIANKLNIRVLGTASEAGEIELVGHTRGEKKMIGMIVKTMEAEGFTGGEVVIDHVENEAGAQALADRIVERWPGSEATIMPCNGLDSYYAEMHGLIIGYGMGIASGR